MTQINLLRQVKNLNFPEWFLINWKIVTSVSSNNLTVAIKTLAWTDPTVYDPIHCRIDWVVRTITSALSVTLAAWGNWLNLWSPELATKEVDLFVYLYYSTTNTAVWLWFSRYPAWNKSSDFNTANDTSEKSIPRSIPNNTTDSFVNIWRFNAILSGGAGYTWSLWTWPVINYPITSTRFLDYIPNWSWFSWTAKYKIDWETMFLIIDSTANITWNITTPFTCTNTVDNQMNTDTWTAVLPKNSNTITVATNPQNINWFYWI